MVPLTDCSKHDQQTLLSTNSLSSMGFVPLVGQVEQGRSNGPVLLLDGFASACSGFPQPARDFIEELDIASFCGSAALAKELHTVEHKGDELVTASNSVLLTNLRSNVTISRPSDDPHGVIIGVTSTEGPTSVYDAVVGEVHFNRLMALSRSNQWWLSPEFGHTTRDIPVETQFLLLELQEGGLYAILLPLIDSQQFRVTIRPPSDVEDANSLKLRVESGCTDVTATRWTGALHIAVSSDPFFLVDQSVCTAAKLSGGAQPRWLKQVPDIVNLFGWCSWDAFYTDVAAKGVAQGVETLGRGATPPRFVVIDDGWQCAAVDGDIAADATGVDKDSEAVQAAVKMLAGGDTQMLSSLHHNHSAAHATNDGPSTAAVICSSLAGTALTAFQEHDDHAAALGNTISGSPKNNTFGHAVLHKRAVTDTAAYGSCNTNEDEDDRSSLYTYPDEHDDTCIASKSSGSTTPLAAAAPSFNGAPNLPTLAQCTAQGSKTLDIQMLSPRLTRKKLLSDMPMVGHQAGPSSSSNSTTHSSAVAETLLCAASNQALYTGAESFKKVLANLEHCNDHHLNGLQDKTPALERDVMELVVTAVTGRLTGVWDVLLAAAFNGCKGLLDGAPKESLRCKMAAFLLAGPLRHLLLKHYAKLSHHSQRLTSIQANSKFTSYRRPTQPSSTVPSPRQSPLISTSKSGAQLAQPPCNDAPLVPACDASYSGGFADFITDLKAKYGVQYVYCWHAAAGFWCGVDVSAGSPMQKYKPQLVYPRPTEGSLEVDPHLAWIQTTVAGVGLVEDVEGLHNDMHAYLAACGVDGVKVDAQSTLGLIGTAVKGGPALSRDFHASLEKSIQRNFHGNHAINCMCHSTENVYRMEHTCIARSSDDFVPDVPSSHTAHIVVNSYNSLFLGALVLPDWDMFHSRHEAALLHASARAISGGPVYVSDKPGRHDFQLLRHLVLPDGRVLRALLPARPTRDCLMEDVWQDGKTLLKVWNVNPCGGVLAAFNVQGSTWDRKKRRYHSHASHVGPLSAVLRPTDVEVMRDVARARAGLLQDVRFVMYRNGDEAVVHVVREDEGIQVTVGHAEVQIWSVVPLMTHHGVSVAPLGIMHMFNGGGAVRSCNLYRTTSTNGNAACGADQSADLHCAITLAGQGVVSVYCTHVPAAVVVNGKRVNFEFVAANNMLQFSVGFRGPDMDHSIDISWELPVGNE